MNILYYGVLIIISITSVEVKNSRVKRIVGGNPANVPPEDDPAVYVRFAGKSARIQGVRDFPHYVFRGIRFAYAPTKKDRFLRSREYFLQGLENATQYPPPCIQPVPGQNTVVGSEDCLFLNVFTPVLPTGMEGLPVVVWIHGGGFRYGSASQYGVRHLVGKQLIIVTIQYRLGSLGFLSSGSKELPGNAALWDMVLAVQWVRNYIGFFGGNPYKIVVMGHGTGASSTLLVALSNVAKGLGVSGVVAMSGSSISRAATDDSPSNTAKVVAEQNGCPTASVLTMVRCLQNLSPDSIIMGDSQIEFQNLQNNGFVTGLSGRTGTAPVTEGLNDGRSLPGLIEREPIDNVSHESNPKIPLLIGITKDETKKACNGIYKKEILTKLNTVPNFLNEILVSNLQKFIGIDPGDNKNKSSQVWNILDPLEFRNYFQVKKDDLKETISKISEATTDALFNVPAFLTADLWTKRGANSFLYRFEHSGKSHKGHYFLKGLSLLGNTSTDSSDDSSVGHGDELSYLFEAQDINGKPLDANNKLTEDDLKVRDIFTQMISDFARFGKLTDSEGKRIPPFSSSNNNFIQIKPKLKLANNFRFCQMALWCGLAQRLQSSTCKFLKVINTQIKNVEDTLVNITKPNVSNLGGLLKIPSNTVVNQTMSFNKDNMKKIGDLLTMGGNANKHTNSNKQLFGLFP